VSAALGDGQRFVPIVAEEFAQIAAFCPIFLAKDSETGAFYFGAMLGFHEGQNLFIDEPNAARFRPLHARRLPFYTAGEDLAIDLGNARVNTVEGEPLFTDAGEPTEYLNNVMEMFRRLRRGEEQTKLFIQTMLELDLVEPVDIDIKFDDGEHIEIDGLYGIKRTAVGELSDDQALMLFRRGYLYLAHVTIMSLTQLPALIQRRNRQQVNASAPYLL